MNRVGTFAGLVLFCCLLLVSATVFAASFDQAQALQQLQNLPASVQQQLKEQYQGKTPGMLSDRVEEFDAVQTEVSVIKPLAVEGDDSAAQGEGVAELEEEMSWLEEPSILELQYRNHFQSKLAIDLNQFGYSLFSTASSVVPQAIVPSEDYIVSPGDQLRIRLWGASVDTEYVATVAVDGTLNVPKIGVVSVAGEQLGQLTGRLKSEALKYMQGININIALEKLHSVEIYVVGEVLRPGLHVVPAFSTLFKGLQIAGGVKKSGSLRQVKLYRGGKEVADFDLYDLVLHGHRAADKVLRNQDVIFVPQIGDTVAVAGAVKQPGIYEISTESDFTQLVDHAGGYLPNAYLKNLYVKRYQAGDRFQVKSLAEADSMPMLPGDLLEVPFAPQAEQTVEVAGAVWRPEIYAFTAGMKVEDLLTMAGGIKEHEFVTDGAYLYRYVPAVMQYEVIRLDLNSAEQGLAVALQPFDKLELLSRNDYDYEEPVRVAGAVRKPGEYVWRKSMTVRDLVDLAGNTVFGARLDRVEVTQVVIEKGVSTTRHQIVDLAKQGDFELQPYDFVNVPKVAKATQMPTVMIEGEVLYPGRYSIEEGERLSDLIRRAGGFTEKAYFYGARFTSEQARAIQQANIDKMINRLQLDVQRAVSEAGQLAASKEGVAAAELGGEAASSLIAELKKIKADGRISMRLAPLNDFAMSAHDFELQDGDALFIPKKPGFVAVVGSVYSPNSFVYEANMDIGDYLQLSGGPTKDADEDHIYVQKANGEVVAAQQKGMFTSFYDQELMPGDTIVVLENLDRIPTLRLFKDLTEIVFRIATTAGIAFAI